MICHSLLPCIFCQFCFARLLRCSLPTAILECKPPWRHCRWPHPEVSGELPAFHRRETRQFSNLSPWRHRNEFNRAATTWSFAVNNKFSARNTEKPPIEYQNVENRVWKNSLKKCIKWHQMTLYSRQFQQTMMLPRSEGHHFFGSPYAHGPSEFVASRNTVTRWKIEQNRRFLRIQSPNNAPFTSQGIPYHVIQMVRFFRIFTFLFSAVILAASFRSTEIRLGLCLLLHLTLPFCIYVSLRDRSGQAIHSVRSRPSTLLGSSGSATNPIFCLDPKHPESQPKLHYSLQSLQVSCRPRLRGSAGPKSSGS